MLLFSAADLIAQPSSFEDARLVTLLELSLNFGQRLRGRMAERAREGDRERETGMFF